MISIKKTTLANKLRILVAPMKSTEAVTVMIMVRAGSRYETKNINGIAHFLEHMFFKGGEKYPTSRDVAEAIDAIGGSFNAFTDHEYVGYYVKVPKEKITTAFDVLSDMLLAAKFDQEGLERERGVIMEEYKMYQDDPRNQISDEFETLLFGDHPLGWPVIGLPKVIQSVSRNDFLKYRDALYSPSNVVVAVAGNTTSQEVTKLVGKYLPIAKGGRKNLPLPYPVKRPSKKFKLVYKKTEQAHLIIGVPSFGSAHPDRYIAQVLSAVLGGGMSSRLFTSVREQHGLAYYVYSYNVNYVDAGYLAAKAGVDVSRIELAISTILDEFKLLTTTEVGAKELKKAKDYLIGHTVLSLEHSDEVAYTFGLQELLRDKTESIAELKKKVQAVTSKDILRVAKSLFRDGSLCLAVIGPYANDSKIKKVYQLK